MSQNCALCQVIEKKRDAHIIFEDELVSAMLHTEPASPGHIVLFPKGHFTIFEQVPEDIVEHMFVVANKLSVACFETLQVGGTNIVVANGVEAGQVIPHMSVHIIPRVDTDHLNFQWTPKQVSEEQMSAIELSLQESHGSHEDHSHKEHGAHDHHDTGGSGGGGHHEDNIPDEENYMIKQLERVP